jgi:hypothetical protein
MELRIMDKPRKTKGAWRETRPKRKAKEYGVNREQFHALIKEAAQPKPKAKKS